MTQLTKQDVFSIFNNALQSSKLKYDKAIDTAYRRAALSAHPDRGGSDDLMQFLDSVCSSRRKQMSNNCSFFLREDATDIVSVGEQNGMVKTVFLSRNCKVDVNEGCRERPSWRTMYVDEYPWTIRFSNSILHVSREQITFSDKETVDLRIERRCYVPVTLAHESAARVICEGYRFWPGEKMEVPFDLRLFEAGILNIPNISDIANADVITIQTTFYTICGRNYLFTVSPRDAVMLHGIEANKKVCVTKNADGLVSMEVPLSSYKTVVVWNTWKRIPALQSRHKAKRKRSESTAQMHEDNCRHTLTAVDGTLISIGDVCDLVLFKNAGCNRTAKWSLLTDEIMKHRYSSIVTNDDNCQNIRLLQCQVESIDEDFFEVSLVTPSLVQKGYITHLKQLTKRWQAHFSPCRNVLSRSFVVKTTINSN